MGKRLFPSFHFDVGSTWRGIRAMHRPYPEPKPGWEIRWCKTYGGHRWWWETWTPAWHQGRGPYVSIGCGFFAICRGY